MWSGPPDRRSRPLSLGVDISRTAVRLTRRRGANALRRDVFSPVPGEGRWRTVLLADGNIGIGGDPARLLGRCCELLAPGGLLHVEVAAPGAGSWSGPVRISTPGGMPSVPFAWAAVSADAVERLSAQSRLQVVEVWQAAGRWFTTLAAL